MCRATAALNSAVSCCSSVVEQVGTGRAGAGRVRAAQHLDERQLLLLRPPVLRRVEEPLHRPTAGRLVDEGAAPGPARSARGRSRGRARRGPGPRRGRAGRRARAGGGSSGGLPRRGRARRAEPRRPARTSAALTGRPARDRGPAPPPGAARAAHARRRGRRCGTPPALAPPETRASSHSRPPVGGRGPGARRAAGRTSAAVRPRGPDAGAGVADDVPHWCTPPRAAPPRAAPPPRARPAAAATGRARAPRGRRRGCREQPVPGGDGQRGHQGGERVRRAERGLPERRGDPARHVGLRTHHGSTPRGRSARAAPGPSGPSAGPRPAPAPGRRRRPRPRAARAGRRRGGRAAGRRGRPRPGRAAPRRPRRAGSPGPTRPRPPAPPAASRGPRGQPGRPVRCRTHLQDLPRDQVRVRGAHGGPSGSRSPRARRGAGATGARCRRLPSGTRPDDDSEQVGPFDRQPLGPAVLGHQLDACCPRREGRSTAPGRRLPPCSRPPPGRPPAAAGDVRLDRLEVHLDRPACLDLSRRLVRGNGGSSTGRRASRRRRSARARRAPAAACRPSGRAPTSAGRGHGGRRVGGVPRRPRRPRSRPTARLPHAVVDPVVAAVHVRLVEDACPPATRGRSAPPARRPTSSTSRIRPAPGCTRRRSGTPPVGTAQHDQGGGRGRRRWSGRRRRACARRARPPAGRRGRPGARARARPGRPPTAGSAVSSPGASVQDAVDRAAAAGRSARAPSRSHSRSPTGRPHAW